MFKKGIKILMITLLDLLMIFNLGGCVKQAESGGTIDHSNKNAPKEIKSKDIIKFSYDFYLHDRWNKNGGHYFNFKITEDELGILTAYENQTKITYKADEELLRGIQNIIDEEELVKLNGLDKYTAGLPSEYQPTTLNVLYASKEQLVITTNNNPTSSFSIKIYTLFSNWFMDKGIDALYPEKEKSLLNRIDITLEEDGQMTSYFGALMDEKRYFFKSIYDEVAKKTISTDNIDFPEDFYTNTTDIINKYDLTREYDFTYHDHNDGYYTLYEKNDNEVDKENLKLEIYMEYESGKIINIETKKQSQINELRPIVDELFGYFEEVFNK